jgi:predicted double-glycine peptidase
MSWMHHKKIERQRFDLTFYDFENTISNKTNAIEMNATPKQSFYLIPKHNQLFSYTKFPVHKINVGKILNYEKSLFYYSSY